MKETKNTNNSPYSKTYKGCIKADQKILIQMRQMVTKLTRKDLEDKYLTLCDENYFLKRTNNQHELTIKQLLTKIVRLQETHRLGTSTTTTVSNESPSNNQSRGNVDGNLCSCKDDLISAKRDFEKELEQLKMKLSAQEHETSKLLNDKEYLEEKLAERNLSKTLNDNIELKNLKRKIEGYKTNMKNYQEKIKTITNSKISTISAERQKNHDLMVKLKNEQSKNSSMLDQVSNTKSLFRLNEIMKLEIAELKFDKQLLMEQQDSFALIIKRAAAFDSVGKDIKCVHDLKESLQKQRTEIAAIENSKDEMFQRLCNLQNLNDKLVLESESNKIKSK